MIQKEICKKCKKLKVIFHKGKSLCRYCYNKKYYYTWKLNNSEYFKEYYQRNKDKFKKKIVKTITTI